MRKSLWVSAVLSITLAGCDVMLPVKTVSIAKSKGPEYVASTPSTLLAYQGGVLVSKFHGGIIERYDAAGNYAGVLAKLNARETDRFAAGCMAMARGKLFVVRIFSESVVAIDPATGKILRELPLGHNGAMCASSDERFLYCVTEEKALSIVDTATFAIEHVEFPDDTKGPSAIALSADGRQLFIGMQRTDTRENSDLRKRGIINGPGLLVYDIAEREFVARTPLTMEDYDGQGNDVGMPNAMLLSPDGTTLFIGMFQSEAGVIMFDTQTHKVAGNIPFDSHNQYFKWADPLSLAIIGDRMLVLLRNNNELAALDWKTRERLGTWPLKHDGSTGHHGIGVTAEKVIVDNGGVDVFNLSEFFRYQRNEQ